MANDSDFVKAGSIALATCSTSANAITSCWGTRTRRMRLTSACCRKTILQVISLYVPELNHQALCEEAIVLFKEVGLAY
ncbi:MAG: hypothetical protein ACK55Z_24575, partial [bacterium]